MPAVTSTLTRLQIGNGASPELYATIAEILDIDGLKLSVNMHDTSSQSLTNPWMTQIPGLLKNEGISCQINFIPSDNTQRFDNTTGLAARALGVLFLNRTLKNYQLVFPAFPEDAIQFAAYVAEYQIKAVVDGVLRASIKLAPTGIPIFHTNAELNQG